MLCADVLRLVFDTTTLLEKVAVNAPPVLRCDTVGGAERYFELRVAGGVANAVSTVSSGVAGTAF